MPLGIISDKEFELEIQESESLKEIVKDIEKGRGGQLEVPDSLRKIISENALEEGNKATQELTSFLGISNSSLTAYKRGVTSTSNYNDSKDSNLGPYREKVRNRIFKKANRLTVRALDSITDDKLESSRALELANIARSASSIMKDMTPEEESLSIQNNQVIIFRPRINEEDDYQIIDVTE